MSEWKEYKLAELGDFFGGVTTIKREDYGFGTPFITYKNVYKNSKVDISVLELMNVKKNDVIKRNCVYGDIFFTASSETPDEVAMSSVLLDNVNDLTFNGFCKRFRLHNFNILNPAFARYLLRGEDFRNSAYEYANGDVRFNISQENLAKISIRIPDLPTQTAIAEILSSLDDKIELNNKINQELETLAQTLFKQWFIDFEFPNENGEPYKSSGGEMVDSELGEIPKGWEVNSLDGIADFLNGLALQKFPPNDEYDYLPVIKIRELRQRDTSNSDKASKSIPEKYIVQNGDVLFSWSGSLLVDFWTNGKGALNQHLFKVTSSQFPKWFFYLWTKHYLSEFIKIAESKATTMGHIQRQHLSDAKVVIPDEMPRFTSIFEPIISNIIDNRIENVQLTTLRDTLLPKLISGELEVNEISI